MSPIHSAEQIEGFEGLIRTLFLELFDVLSLLLIFVRHFKAPKTR